MRKKEDINSEAGSRQCVQKRVDGHRAPVKKNKNIVKDWFLNFYK
ncbi:MAG: hypothetical protein RL329_3947 [Bacteroidota bacterium]